MKKTEQPKVKIVLGKAHKVKAGDKVLVTIDPAFADLAQHVSESLWGLGVEAIVVPLPKDALQFYSIEQNVHVELAPPIQPPIQEILDEQS